VPEQHEEEAEDDPPLQCMGQREAPLILEIVKAEAGMMRDEGGGIRHPTNEIRSLPKRRKLMRRNMEKLRRTQYCSQGP